MKRILPAILLLAQACATPAPDPPFGPELSITWEKNILSIQGRDVPGGRVEVWYLEAFCRSGSTHRDWKQTVIPHQTYKVAEHPEEKSLELRSHVEGGVEVIHHLQARPGEVEIQVEAVNRGAEYVDAVWVQPCIRVGGFTEKDQKGYVGKCFIFVDGKPTSLDKARRTEEAIYKGGQVYVPSGIERRDVNPRPLSPDVPSNGLIGCVSGDGKMLLATAWEPYQELFQGVIICVHSDFRLGGLKPGETKKARGKIYIMQNDAARLLARYRQDFPVQAAREQ